MSYIVTIKILTSGHGQRESIKEETKHLAHLGHTLLHGDGGDEGLLHLRVQVRLQLKLSLQVAIGDASHVDEEQDDVADVEIVGMPGSCVVAMELPEHWVRQKDIDGVADITARKLKIITPKSELVLMSDGHLSVVAPDTACQ